MGNLAEAIIRVIEAKTKFDKAYAETEYDKGYFTHYERERLDDAVKNLESELEQIIDERIKQLIGTGKDITP